jgi:ABC-type multidrug transport system fused ATPase/permease subunit
MSCTAVRRASSLAGPAGRPWAVYPLSGLSAISTTLLILVVGLICDLLIKRDAPIEQSLGRLFESGSLRGWGDWPWLATYDSSLLMLIGVLVVLGVLESALLLALHRTAESASFRVMARLQTLIGQQAARLGTRAAREVPPSKAGALLTEVCEQLRRDMAVRWRVAPRTFILLPLLLAVGLAMDFFLALYTLLLCVFAYWVYRLYRERVDRQSAACRQSAENRSGALRDRAQTELLIATRSPEAKPAAEFEEAAQRYRQPLRQAAAWEATRIPSLVLLISMCTGLLALVAGLSSDASMTRVLLLALLYARGYLPARRLLQVCSDAGSAETAASEILAFLDQTPLVQPDDGGRQLEPPARPIRFEQLSIGHATDAGLDSITLEVPAGSRVALVGDRPELLLLLTDLLLRYCDPDSGRVLIDGVDLREYSLASIRRQAAFAPRHGHLLSGTIADNLRCGRPGLDMERLEEVAASCRVLDFVQQSTHGFYTTIGPLGRSVDPAVAFRLGLARSIVVEPSLIVIEEPAEPQDEDTRHQLELAMAAATAGRTSIVLASRLNTLRTADQVFVFYEGRLHRQGEHSELLKHDALYRHLNYLWFNPYTGMGNASLPSG